MPSSNSTEMSAGSVGKPLPSIVRRSPPAISMSSFGLTSVASNGVITVIGPTVLDYPSLPVTVTSKSPSDDIGLRRQVIYVSVRV